MANYLAYTPSQVKANWPIDVCRSANFINHMSDVSFRERFIEALDASGLSVAEVARRSGVSYDVINKLKRRSVRSTTHEKAKALSMALGLDMDSDFEEPAPQSQVQRIENGDAAPIGAALVPVFDVRASAGHGAINHDEMEVHSLAFPPSYLKKLTSSSPGNLAIISVKGESMEPTLLDDDIVLLDASKTNLSYDGLFVIRFDDALHVKRVGRSGRKGHIMIISDNSSLYPPFEADASEIEAVGKVLWYGRKV